MEIKKLLLKNEEIYKSICIYQKYLIGLQDSELTQNQNCYEPCETEFKMMTDFALEIAFAVFIIFSLFSLLRSYGEHYPGVDYLVMGYKCYDLTREAPATPAPAPPLHTRQQLDD